MSNPNLRVKVYGARGSYSPTRSQETKIGVNTTCLRIDVGQHVLIFDAGSGIINCGKDLIKEINSEADGARKWHINLFFTHLHIDHLVGFPYFLMLYMPQAQIDFYSPKILDYELPDILDSFVHPPYFPVAMEELPFRRTFNRIRENAAVYVYPDRLDLSPVLEAPRDDWQAKITTMRNYMHPKGGSYFYKIETRDGKRVVIASDTEGFVGADQRLVKFAKDADLLFHDAQYNLAEYAMFQGFGHSTYEMACEVAQKANVKRLLLIHHDPNHDDQQLGEIEANAQKIFPSTFLASEAMSFDF